MCNDLPNFYVFCVMIVQTLHSMLKSSKNITHMHRCHASNVIKSRTVALFWGKIAVHFALFSDKFTRLARILHDRRSHRSRQISTLVKSAKLQTEHPHHNCLDCLRLHLNAPKPLRILKFCLP